LKAEYTAALERVREWDAEHPEFKEVLVSETLGTSGNIERVSSRLSSPLRDRMSNLSNKMREVVRQARIRNVSESPLTRGWVSFGKKFLDLLNYRRHGGSQAFSGHVTNAKSGRIKDWSWAEKEKATPVRKATKEEVR